MKSPIPPEKPIFRDGQTGAFVVFGECSTAQRVDSPDDSDVACRRHPRIRSVVPRRSRRRFLAHRRCPQPDAGTRLRVRPFRQPRRHHLARRPLALAQLPPLCHPRLRSPRIRSHPDGRQPGSQPARSRAHPDSFATGRDRDDRSRPVQAAFKLLTPELQSKLAYPTAGNVFIVDLEADDYGVSASALSQVPSSIDGWSVQDWKVLVPANPKPFTPPKYVGSEDALRAAMIVSPLRLVVPPSCVRLSSC
jgi:hypothetical protein